jgi:hypothetical protein
MNRRHFPALLIFAILAVLTSMPGLAQGPAPDLFSEKDVAGWRSDRFNLVDVDQRNVPASEREVEYTGVMAHTANSEAPGLLLTCTEKKELSATFSVAGVDFGDSAIMNAKTRIKVLRGRLIIDGVRPVSKEQYLLRRKLNVIQTMNIQSAFTVINAIYEKKSVRLEVDGQDAVDYTLPPVDDELREFVANCPAFKKGGE